ncbi:MAG: nucleotide-binding protein [Comamonadaceae bacterium]|nr:nucleotide-binding protein [Comamonadaceae bacterium]
MLFLLNNSADIEGQTVELGKPIILLEQPNEGKTIIEKFERNADVSFAIVLLTPDDQGNAIEQSKEVRSRSRQNVILELGYFTGRLGRDRVCPLYQSGVELPSDIHGLVYVEMDKRGAWKMDLIKELRQAKLPIATSDLL